MILYNLILILSNLSFLPFLQTPVFYAVSYNLNYVCNALNIYVFSKCLYVWRWSLWEVIRSWRWSPNEWVPIAEARELASSLSSMYGSVSSVQSLSHVWLFVTPWTAACQASLSITNSQSLLELKSITLVMPSNHLLLCCPLLHLLSIFPSIRVFSSESVLCIRWPKYWSFSFSIRPSNEYSELISSRMVWLDLLAAQGTLKSLL